MKASTELREATALTIAQVSELPVSDAEDTGAVNVPQWGWLGECSLLHSLEIGLGLDSAVWRGKV